MNRRGFLGAMLAAASAPAIISSGVLMPVRAIVTATAEECELVLMSGNRLLTIQEITREALRMLNKQMNFISSTNRQFDAKQGDRLVIRVPEPYRAAA